MNLKHLKQICHQLQLGLPKDTVEKIHGGRGGHLMWRVYTAKGSYAIKQLDPAFDLENKKIITKYELSETIADQFIQQGISAVSAIKNSENHLVILDDTCYLVYPWIEGYTLSHHKISQPHALKIAEVLAKLHGVNLNNSEIGPIRFDIHPNDKIVNAIDRVGSLNCSFSDMLKENIHLILSVNNLYLDVIPVLQENNVVTHGDLDQNNVIWDSDDKPILIDWESARRMNPTHEIVRTSWGWSGIARDDASLPLFAHMFRKYMECGGLLNKNHVNAALNAMYGTLVNWILYNIETACGSDVSEKRDVAVKEIHSVIKGMKRLNTLIPDLLSIL